MQIMFEDQDLGLNLDSINEGYDEVVAAALATYRKSIDEFELQFKNNKITADVLAQKRKLIEKTKQEALNSAGVLYGFKKEKEKEAKESISVAEAEKRTKAINDKLAKDLEAVKVKEFKSNDWKTKQKATLEKEASDKIKAVRSAAGLINKKASNKNKTPEKLLDVDNMFKQPKHINAEPTKAKVDPVKRNGNVADNSKINSSKFNFAVQVEAPKAKVDPSKPKTEFPIYSSEFEPKSVNWDKAHSDAAKKQKLRDDSIKAAIEKSKHLEAENKQKAQEEAEQKATEATDKAKKNSFRDKLPNINLDDEADKQNKLNREKTSQIKEPELRQDPISMNIPDLSHIKKGIESFDAKLPKHIENEEALYKNKIYKANDELLGKELESKLKELTNNKPDFDLEKNKIAELKTDFLKANGRELSPEKIQELNDKHASLENMFKNRESNHANIKAVKEENRNYAELEQEKYDNGELDSTVEKEPPHKDDDELRQNKEGYVNNYALSIAHHKMILNNLINTKKQALMKSALDFHDKQKQELNNKSKEVGFTPSMKSALMAKHDKAYQNAIGPSGSLNFEYQLNLAFREPKLGIREAEKKLKNFENEPAFRTNMVLDDAIKENERYLDKKNKNFKEVYGNIAEITDSNNKRLNTNFHSDPRKQAFLNLFQNTPEFDKLGTKTSNNEFHIGDKTPDEYNRDTIHDSLEGLKSSIEKFKEDDDSLSKFERQEMANRHDKDKAMMSPEEYAAKRPERKKEIEDFKNKPENNLDYTHLDDKVDQLQDDKEDLEKNYTADKYQKYRDNFRNLSDELDNHIQKYIEPRKVKNGIEQGESINQKFMSNRAKANKEIEQIEATKKASIDQPEVKHDNSARNFLNKFKSVNTEETPKGISFEDDAKNQEIEKKAANPESVFGKAKINPTFDNLQLKDELKNKSAGLGLNAEDSLEIAKPKDKTPAELAAEKQSQTAWYKDQISKSFPLGNPTPEEVQSHRSNLLKLLANNRESGIEAFDNHQKAKAEEIKNQEIKFPVKKQIARAVRKGQEDAQPIKGFVAQQLKQSAEDIKKSEDELPINIKNDVKEVQPDSSREQPKNTDKQVNSPIKGFVAQQLKQSAEDIKKSEDELPVNIKSDEEKPKELEDKGFKYISKHPKIQSLEDYAHKLKQELIKTHADHKELQNYINTKTKEDLPNKNDKQRASERQEGLNKLRIREYDTEHGGLSNDISSLEKHSADDFKRLNGIKDTIDKIKSSGAERLHPIVSANLASYEEAYAKEEKKLKDKFRNIVNNHLKPTKEKLAQYDIDKIKKANSEKQAEHADRVSKYWDQNRDDRRANELLKREYEKKANEREDFKKLKTPEERANFKDNMKNAGRDTAHLTNQLLPEPVYKKLPPVPEYGTTSTSKNISSYLKKEGEGTKEVEQNATPDELPVNIKSETPDELPLNIKPEVKVEPQSEPAIDKPTEVEDLSDIEVKKPEANDIPGKQDTEEQDDYPDPYFKSVVKNHYNLDGYSDAHKRYDRRDFEQAEYEHDRDLDNHESDIETYKVRLGDNYDEAKKEFDENQKNADYPLDLGDFMKDYMMHNDLEPQYSEDEIAADEKEQAGIRKYGSYYGWLRDKFMDNQQRLDGSDEEFEKYVKNRMERQPELKVKIDSEIAARDKEEAERDARDAENNDDAEGYTGYAEPEKSDTEAKEIDQAFNKDEPAEVENTNIQPKDDNEEAGIAKYGKNTYKLLRLTYRNKGLTGDFDKFAREKMDSDPKIRKYSEDELDNKSRQDMFARLLKERPVDSKDTKSTEEKPEDTSAKELDKAFDKDTSNEPEVKSDEEQPEEADAKEEPKRYVDDPDDPEDIYNKYDNHKQDMLDAGKKPHSFKKFKQMIDKYDAESEDGPQDEPRTKTAQDYANGKYLNASPEERARARQRIHAENILYNKRKDKAIDSRLGDRGPLVQDEGFLGKLAKYYNIGKSINSPEKEREAITKYKEHAQHHLDSIDRLKKELGDGYAEAFHAFNVAQVGKSNPIDINAFMKNYQDEKAKLAEKEPEEISKDPEATELDQTFNKNKDEQPEKVDTEEKPSNVIDNSSTEDDLDNEDDLDAAELDDILNDKDVKETPKEETPEITKEPEFSPEQEMKFAWQDHNDELEAQGKPKIAFSRYKNELILKKKAEDAAEAAKNKQPQEEPKKVGSPETPKDSEAKEIDKAFNKDNAEKEDSGDTNSDEQPDNIEKDPEAEEIDKTFNKDDIEVDPEIANSGNEDELEVDPYSGDTEEIPNDIEEKPDYNELPDDSEELPDGEKDDLDLPDDPLEVPDDTEEQNPDAEEIDKIYTTPKKVEDPEDIHKSIEDIAKDIDKTYADGNKSNGEKEKKIIPSKLKRLGEEPYQDLPVEDEVKPEDDLEVKPPENTSTDADTEEQTSDTEEQPEDNAENPDELEVKPPEENPLDKIKQDALEKVTNGAKTSRGKALNAFSASKVHFNALNDKHEERQNALKQNYAKVYAEKEQEFKEDPEHAGENYNSPENKILIRNSVNKAFPSYAPEMEKLKNDKIELMHKEQGHNRLINNFAKNLDSNVEKFKDEINSPDTTKDNIHLKIGAFHQNNPTVHDTDLSTKMFKLDNNLKSQNGHSIAKDSTLNDLSKNLEVKPYTTKIESPSNTSNKEDLQNKAEKVKRLLSTSSSNVSSEIAKIKEHNRSTFDNTKYTELQHRHESMMDKHADLADEAKDKLETENPGANHSEDDVVNIMRSKSPEFKQEYDKFSDDLENVQKTEKNHEANLKKHTENFYANKLRLENTIQDKSSRGEDFEDDVHQFYKENPMAHDRNNLHNSFELNDNLTTSNGHQIHPKSTVDDVTNNVKSQDYVPHDLKDEPKESSRLITLKPSKLSPEDYEKEHTKQEHRLINQHAFIDNKLKDASDHEDKTHVENKAKLARSAVDLIQQHGELMHDASDEFKKEKGVDPSPRQLTDKMLEIDQRRSEAQKVRPKFTEEYAAIKKHISEELPKENERHDAEKKRLWSNVSSNNNKLKNILGTLATRKAKGHDFEDDVHNFHHENPEYRDPSKVKTNVPTQVKKADSQEMTAPEHDDGSDLEVHHNPVSNDKALVRHDGNNKVIHPPKENVKFPDKTSKEKETPIDFQARGEAGKHLTRMFMHSLGLGGLDALNTKKGEKFSNIVKAVGEPVDRAIEKTGGAIKDKMHQSKFVPQIVKKHLDKPYFVRHISYKNPNDPNSGKDVKITIIRAHNYDDAEKAFKDKNPKRRVTHVKMVRLNGGADASNTNNSGSNSNNSNNSPSVGSQQNALATSANAQASHTNNSGSNSAHQHPPDSREALMNKIDADRQARLGDMLQSRADHALDITNARNERINKMRPFQKDSAEYKRRAKEHEQFKSQEKVSHDLHVASLKNAENAKRREEDALIRKAKPSGSHARPETTGKNKKQANTPSFIDHQHDATADDMRRIRD